tara:strand:+ start:1715 stop:2353 length:639 start_codon:yes stop_codon:yes gene_type:complete
MNILEIRNIHIYNLNSNLITIEKNINKINIQSEIENLSPILLKNIYIEDICNKSLLKLSPGYMIKDSEKYISLKELKKDYYIYENEKIIKDLDINIKQILNLFENRLTVNRRSYLSLYGENVQSILLRCFHNINCYTSSDDFTFYLFNPKHFHDIFGKELHKIKKWAIKVEIKRGDILYIPCEWNYIYEGKGNLLKVTCDNYFSVGYNLVRE